MKNTVWLKELPLIIIFGFIIWLSSDVLLLFFAGILLSIILGIPTDFLSQKTALSRKLAFVITLFLIIGVTYILSSLFSSPIMKQVNELQQTIPQSVFKLQEKLQSYEWISQLIERIDLSRLLETRGGIISQATSAVSKTLTVVTYILIILFVGIYVGYEPDLYKKGLLQLILPTYRKRADAILSSIAHNLRWWLAAKGISMIIIGILTAIGLILLDIPLGLLLGVIAGIFAFIPVIGPILSSLPAIMLGLTLSPSKALYVILLYLGVQTIDDYIVSPFAEKKTVQLPPALTIIVQLFMSVMFGFLGVVLAAPLLVITMILTKELYVRDILERKHAFG